MACKGGYKPIRSEMHAGYIREVSNNCAAMNGSSYFVLFVLGMSLAAAKLPSLGGLKDKLPSLRFAGRQGFISFGDHLRRLVSAQDGRVIGLHEAFPWPSTAKSVDGLRKRPADILMAS